MHCLKILGLLCILIGSIPTAFAVPEVEIDPSFDKLTMGRHLEFFYDESGNQTLDDVRSPAVADLWQSSSKDVPTFGYRKGALWARWAIKDKRNRLDTLILEFTYPQADYVDLFILTPGGTISKQGSGDHRERRLWNMDTRFPSFALPAQSEQTLYFKISGESSQQLPLTLWDVHEYSKEKTQREVFQALYYGALIAMTIYNFLVFFGTGLRVYLAYVCFLISNAIFQTSFSGVGYAVLWRDFPYLNDIGVVSGVAGFGVFANLFAVMLLGFSFKERLVKTSVFYFIASAGLVVLSYLFSGYGLSIRVAIIFCAFPCLSALSIFGFIAWRRKEEVAAWYALAWMTFIIGTLFVPLSALGFLPVNNFTSNAQQIGSAVEFILLSFALAQRIKTLQKRVETEKENALDAEKRAREADTKALAEERTLNEQRDQLVANTSHELRTPLNGMMGLIQAVQNRDGDKLSPASQKSLQGVVQSSKRLAALIGDLLDFSRGQRGHMPLYRGRIDLAPQVETVCDLLAVTLELRPIKLEFKIPPDLPPIEADVNRVQQILFNLLGNALKFTEKGHVIVRAKHDENFVIISVEDTGPGIPPEAQTRIFEAFAQADGGIARRFGGTGLGLAITKQLVEAHGGQMGLKSVPGFGSTFWFSLPISTSDQSPLQSAAHHLLSERVVSLQTQIVAASAGQTEEQSMPSSSPVPLAKNERSLSILVADDEPLNRQVLEELLSLSGHQPILVANGRDALLFIERNSLPDLVLLDVMMPGMSGLEVLSELRKSYNEAELPVLLLTAKALEKDIVQGFELGASDYILKPFVGSEVEARIRHQARLREAMWSSQKAREEGAALRHQLAQTEEQFLHAERLSSIGAATAGIAHDLGNPLHHIRTTLGWIREHSQSLDQSPLLPEPLRPHVQGIVSSTELADKAAKTSSDLTTAIRVAVRTDANTRDLVVLADVIDDILVLLNHKLKHLEVQRDLDRSLSVMGKRSEIIQLIMNLVSNAADALALQDRKCLTIRVSLSDGKVLLSVEDSGPGIPEKIKAMIFEPFYTTKPSGQGTGLGLAVVRTILKHQQGELEVDTSPELGGARFRITMPAA